MPDKPISYESNDQLPADVRQLDTAAQDLWRITFNETLVSEGRVLRAVNAAWQAVKKAPA